ncbi:MAG TPA: hypothetical protein VKG24_32050 [Pseudolabrys sp.]|nr:hypothetical protein [Pseudolabrys sp.]
MFVLLQIYPPEATAEDGSDDYCCLDVIAVDPSEAKLRGYLASYRFRYAAACEEFDAWDDHTKDWGKEHDRMHHELRQGYSVRGSLIKGTTFKIVKCLSDDNDAYWDPDEPEPTLSPVAYGG